MAVLLLGSWKFSNGVKEDAPIGNLHRQEALSFSSLYDQHIQHLFNYGMHACNNRELVTECLKGLFTQIRSHSIVLGVNGSVRPNLFKYFRRLLVQKILALEKLSGVFGNTSESPFEFTRLNDHLFIRQVYFAMETTEMKRPTQELTNIHREAVFLNFCNEFSYHEVAIIIDLDVRSIYTMINTFIAVLSK